jgi:hypothetical protein
MARLPTLCLARFLSKATGFFQTITAWRFAAIGTIFLIACFQDHVHILQAVDFSLLIDEFTPRENEYTLGLEEANIKKFLLEVESRWPRFVKPCKPKVWHLGDYLKRKIFIHRPRKMVVNCYSKKIENQSLIFALRPTDKLGYNGRGSNYSSFSPKKKVKLIFF